jgi:transposase
MERRAYTSDLTDEQWELLEPLLPKILPWGRPREHSYREILNGIFYVMKTGCQWRNLPHDLPPWSTVHDYYRQWRMDGRWKRINDRLTKQVRRMEGREETPSAGSIDSQSSKTTECARAEPEKKGARSDRQSVTTPERR